MKKVFKVIKFILITLLFLLAAAVAVYALLPWALNRWAMPELGKRFNVSGRVRSAGLTGADIDDLQGSFGRINSVRADYRIKFNGISKPAFVLERLEIEDVAINFSKRDGRWSCDTVFDFGASSGEKTESTQFDIKSFRSPIDFKTLVLRNARIGIDLEGDKYVFPADLELERSLSPAGEEIFNLDCAVLFEGRIQKLTLALNPARREADFTLDAVARGMAAEIQGKGKLPDFASENITVSGKGVFSGAAAGGFSGTAEFALDFSPESLNGKLSLLGSGAAMEGNVKSSFTLDAARNGGKISFSSQLNPEFLNELKAIRIPGGVSVSGSMAEGKLSYVLHSGSLCYDKTELSSLVINGIGGDFSGSIKASSLCPGLAAAFTGKILSLNEVIFNLSIKDFQPEEPLKFENFSASGKLSAQLDGSYRNGTFSAALNLRLKEGKVENTVDNICLENIALNMDFPALPELRSGPEQRLAIDKITFGEYIFSDLSCRFQIHSPRLFTLYGGDCVWNGGLLILPSITLRPGQTSLKSCFRCENLPMGKTLNALGLKEVASSGELFGKIPFSINKNGIFFQDARLYTLPGEKYSFRLGDGGQLSGMVENVANLDLAVEALKDFEFSLAKVDFRTEGEILRVTLSLDGKPNRELPFVWDEKTGSLLRSGSGGKVRLQGLKLDLNLNIPLNRLLKVNNAINNLRGKYSK